jgi:hypothetical protein
VFIPNVQIEININTQYPIGMFKWAYSLNIGPKHQKIQYNLSYEVFNSISSLKKNNGYDIRFGPMLLAKASNAKNPFHSFH